MTMNDPNRDYRGDDLNRTYRRDDLDRDLRRDDEGMSTGMWFGIALAAVLIIGGLFYAVSSNDSRMASDTGTRPAATTGTGTTAPPSPKPAPAPAPTQAK